MLHNDSKILVICTGNSCRSQMAEGWLRHFLNERGLTDAAHNVRSTGIEAHGVNPQAVQVMAEAGIDISEHTSSTLSEYAGETFDIVITVCDNAKERCPAFPAGTRQIHWSFDDPAAATGSEDEIMAVFRRVRDEIRDRVSDYLGLPDPQRRA